MRLEYAAALAALALSPSTALAHHSGAMFDRTKTVTIVGEIKKFDYVNPHAWLDITAPDASGKTAEWSVEMSAPIGLKKVGLTPSNLKVGDKITVHAHPLRDGRPGGSFIDVQLADGRVISSVTTPPQAAPVAPN